MKTILVAILLFGAFVLAGCDDGGPEKIVDVEENVIEIWPLPAGISAPWTLTGPDGFSLSDTGQFTVQDVEIGDYSMSWDYVSGWRNTPADSAFTLAADSTGTFWGVYTNDLPAATNEDILMSHFREVYSYMDYANFSNLLHPDHKLILISETIRNWNWAEGTVFDRNTMLTIHENMFGGSPGIDHNGNNIAPLGNITIDLFEQIGNWTPVALEEVDFPGCNKALFQIKFYFNDDSGTHSFEVDQQILFYVDNIEETYYIKGIRPISSNQNKDAGNLSLDVLLSKYQ